jgi:hypothetical protein
MNPGKQPRDGLLLRWGKYEFQAFGIPAILVVVAVAALCARLLGLI